MARRLALSLCLAMLSATAAQASESVDGRYGRTEVRYVAGKPAVFHKGQKALVLNEADKASIVRVIPGTAQDFVLIQSWKPADKCPASYRLLNVPGSGTLQATTEIGRCMDLVGITLAGTYPVLHFQQAGKAAKVEQLMWKDGAQIELPATTAACFSRHEQAAEKGSRIAPQQAAHLVIGEGRLQFNSAPDEHCAAAGTFVVPGDSLMASRLYGRYTLVLYQHPKSGKATVGWVDSARLKPAQ